jgi:hypothetical protein
VTKLLFILAIFHGSLSLASGSTGHADTALINKHLQIITKTDGFRNHRNLTLLNKTAAYIFNVFEQAADTTYFQEFEADGKIYKNVICSFGSKNSKRVIVGAHYDVCENQEGADDNASGVVGLLELSRLLKNQKLAHRVDLVAYTLEEPPYFRSKLMGSYIHAKSLSDSKAEVYGMISLEMIGFFRDEKKTQSYPVGMLKLFYGSRGNYITLVNKFHPGKFSRKFSKEFKRMDTIRAKKFKGPASLPGIDFSDHLNYWSFGYSALMITDTAFYRNKGYHESIDKMETLDIPRMAKVIDGVFKTLTNLH